MSKDKYTELLMKIRPMLQSPGEALSLTSTVRRGYEFLKSTTPSPLGAPENPYTLGFLAGFNNVEAARLSHFETLGPDLHGQVRELFAVAKTPQHPKMETPERAIRKEHFYAELKRVHNIIAGMGFTTGKTTMIISLEVFIDFIRVKKCNMVIGNGFDQKVYKYAVTEGEKAAMEVNDKFLKTLCSEDLRRLSPDPPILERNVTPERKSPVSTPIELPAPIPIRHRDFANPRVHRLPRQRLFAHAGSFITNTPFLHSNSSGFSHLQFLNDPNSIPIQYCLNQAAGAAQAARAAQAAQAALTNTSSVPTQQVQPPPLQPVMTAQDILTLLQVSNNNNTLDPNIVNLFNN